MPSRSRSVVALLDGQARARDRLHAQVEAVVEREVRGFDRWYSDGEVEALASRLVGVVEAGQRQTARLTDAYLAGILSTLVGRGIRSVGIRVDPTALRNGANHVEVYTRLGSDYRYRVSTGTAPELAASAIVARAGAMSQIDMSLAMRDSARQVYSAHPFISGYRRVIRPELSRDGNCDLCGGATEDTYGKSDLLPIHANCRCETMPVVGRTDPGKSLNAADQVLSTTKAEMSPRVVSHGELGPLLVAEGQHFEGFRPSLQR